MLITITVNDDLLKDLIITALEGGSNYWYDLDPRDILKIKKMFSPDFKERHACSELIAMGILEKQFKLPVYDIQDDDGHELLGYLSIDSIREGLRLMSENDPEALGDIFSEGWDANSADLFFQFVVLKKIIYG